jgi:hypothetical protein
MNQNKKDMTKVEKLKRDIRILCDDDHDLNLITKLICNSRIKMEQESNMLKWGHPMTPREKALSLREDMLMVIDSNWEASQQCIIICIKEIMNYCDDDDTIYWNEVLKEIKCM